MCPSSHVKAPGKVPSEETMHHPWRLFFEYWEKWENVGSSLSDAEEVTRRQGNRQGRFRRPRLSVASGRMVLKMNDTLDTEKR